MNRFVRSTLSVAVPLAMGTMLLSACSSSSDDDDVMPPPPGMGNVFAVTDANDLIRFDADNPGDVEVVGSLAGMQVVGLDFRPADGDLFALTAAGELLILNPETGAILETVLPDVAEAPSLSGQLDIDFNPAANALRITGSVGKRNLRVGPGDFTPENATDPALEDGTFGYRQAVGSTAYTNNDPDTDGTAHFTIDADATTLYSQASNPGLLTEIGELFPGDSTSNTMIGYDIFQSAAGDNEHWLALERNGMAGLYRLDPETGAASLQATLPAANGTYIDLTVAEGDASGTREFLLLDNGMTPQIVVVEAAANVEGNASLPASETLGIDGLDGEELVGFDQRRGPSNAVVGDGGMDPLETGVYAFGADGGIFVLSQPGGSGSNVVATSIGTLTEELQGSRFSVDFNTAVDLVRILSDSGQNLRVNLQDGRILAEEARDAGFAFVDGTVRLGDTMEPDVVAVGYRPAPQQLDGQTPSLDFQYVIDNRGDTSRLARVIVPNDGALLEVGELGVGALSGVAQQSMDITQGNSAFAALVLDGESVSRLYALDLMAGSASEVGTIGDGTFTVTAITATLDTE